ncbi:MAG TPA: efflux RND transporter periplasmic adaptor subunit [Phycisphaerae bacterium]|nr:efflux RND transporter periplasmic adaptor subunit [Phycisphaerae bacterium]
MRAKWMVMLWAGAAMSACQKGAPQQQATRPPPPVTVATAIQQDVPQYIDEIGHTAASELVNITPQVEGQITERLFQDGAMVSKGQHLFTIDPRPYEAKVKQAEANVQHALAQKELAEADYRRLQQAFSVHAASQEDLDTKKAALDTAVADVAVNQADLDTAKLNLSFCYIDSPIDGRAGQRLVDVGNVVNANQTSILTVQRLQPLYVDFTVTERDFPEVRKLSDEGTLQVQVTVPQNPSEVRSGPLTFLDTSIQPGAGRLRVQATLKNEDKFLWPGQFVNVRLVLRTLKGAVLIPYQCTQMGQQGPYVYVLSADSKAEQVPIQMGQRQGAMVVVEKGLKAGDRVVQTGQLSVTPGGEVRVVAPVEGVPSVPVGGPSTQESGTAGAATPATTSAPAGGGE